MDSETHAYLLRITNAAKEPDPQKRSSAFGRIEADLEKRKKQGLGTPLRSTRK